MSKYNSENGIPLDIPNLVILGKLYLKLSELLGDGDVAMGCFQLDTMEVERAEGSNYPMDVLENTYSEVDSKEDVDYTKEWVDSYLMALFRNADSIQSYVLLVERHRLILGLIREDDSILNRSLGFSLLVEKLDDLYGNLFIRLLGISVKGREFEELKFCTENSRWRKWIKSLEGRENIPVDAETLEILGKLSDMLSEDMLSEEEPDQPLMMEGKGKGKESEAEQPLLRKGKGKGKGKGMKEFQHMDYIEKGRKEFKQLNIGSTESGGGARERMDVPFKKLDESRGRRERMPVESRGGRERMAVEKKRENLSLIPMDSQESARGRVETTIRELTDKANKIINKDKKDIEPIKIWVGDYLKNIRHGSCSFQSYFNRINRDMGRLNNFMEWLRDFMLLNPSLSHDSLFSIIIAYEMLNEREDHLYEVFFIDIEGEFKHTAISLSSQLEDDLLRLRHSREADSYLVIGRLIVTKGIGEDCDGIPLLEGYYREGYYRSWRPQLWRPLLVTVKHFPKTHYSLVVKEKRHLIESVKHANVTTCLGVESNEEFLYICLEPYMYSLYDLIVENGDGENKLLWRNGFASQLLKNLMWDIAAGLTHLHSLKIVHGDLKPHHVLVIETSLRLTAKISQIGISQTPICISHTRMRNPGWQSREVLRGESQDASADLFSLGCIMFFCITQGKHPFGEYPSERDANIIRDEKNLFLIEDFPEAFDLISRLLNSNPELRPKAEEVIHHPLFWDSEMPKT